MTTREDTGASSAPGLTIRVRAMFPANKGNTALFGSIDMRWAGDMNLAFPRVVPSYDRGEA